MREAGAAARRKRAAVVSSQGQNVRARMPRRAPLTSPPAAEQPRRDADPNARCGAARRVTAPLRPGDRRQNVAAGRQQTSGLGEPGWKMWILRGELGAGADGALPARPHLSPPPPRYIAMDAGAARGTAGERCTGPGGRAEISGRASARGLGSSGERVRRKSGPVYIMLLGLPTQRGRGAS